MNAADLLASLPDGWRSVPLKTVCDFSVSNVDKHSFDDELPVRLCNYTDVYKNDRVSPDMGLMAATATPQEIERFHLEVGDVVITKDSESWNDIAVPAYVQATSEDFVCGYHLALIRPRKEVFDGRFLFRCMQSRPVALQLELKATGVTRYGLPKDAIGLAVLPLPPLPAQVRIANYLDCETARIDGLIAEKERMLALLEEKRAALISRVVTRGLDPTSSPGANLNAEGGPKGEGKDSPSSAPLKPSGQEWLGEIPAHWRVLRLKFATSGIDQGSSPQCYSYPAEPGECGVLKTGCVNGGEFREHENKALPDETEAFPESEVHQGDVLMSRASGSVNLIGSVAHVSRQPAARLLLSDKIYRFRVRGDVLSPHFLVLAMGARYLRHQIKSVISGAEGLANNVAKSDIMELLLVVPPVPEQERIVSYLDRAISSNRVLCDALSESITLAKEHRAALITAAVTGKIPLEAMRV
ncbi:MAG: restriction endonuclease subunit S [Gammaproteobacteria bacterium]